MDDTGRPVAFESELAALAVAFTERLHLRLAELLDAQAELRAAAGAAAREAAFDQIRILAHGINGSAATFGHPALSEAAEALEAAMMEVLSDATNGARETHAAGLLASLIDAVAAAAQSAQSGSATR